MDTKKRINIRLKEKDFKKLTKDKIIIKRGYEIKLFGIDQRQMVDILFDNIDELNKER